MQMRPLGPSGLSTAPVVFGGNVLGWTIDEAQGFRVLDAFVDHGFTAIDTADVYSAWAPGNSGGESEAILGRWLAARPGMRERVTIFTKVGSEMGAPERKGLSRAWIAEAAEDSLRRLGTGTIDLYFSHWPDETVTHEETLRAYEALIAAGKVRAIGASNYDAGLLGGAREAAVKTGLPGYSVIQPEYNLYDRAGFEGALQDMAEGLGVVTYFSLASGFLTGKYRSAADAAKGSRGGRVAGYFDAKGERILAALDRVAEETGAAPSEIALAWVMARPGVTAPIASATSVAQVESFARAAELRLTGAQMQALTAAGD
ncbi:aldo/keto reductase [Frigidibacter sp. MR17.24]|uniref:aldo/keto reductase n=1 Tax=Frigidibacter sp. MR17.24 TaxID=3127345 RepID=UPI003012BAF0